MYEWDLSDLYPSYESDNFQNDIKKLDSAFDEFKNFKLEDDIISIKKAIQLLENTSVVVRKLFCYISLRESTNTSDKDTANYSYLVGTKYANLEGEFAKFHKFFGNIKTDISKDEYLVQYKFLFEEAKRDAKHILSDEVEEVISKMNLSAGSSWSSMQSYLTSTVEGEMNGEKITLPQVRNLSYDEDSSVRREAYFTELKMYKNIKDPIAFSLNNIKSQVNDISKLRGFSSPLEETLENSRMSKETLDALLSAMKDAFPKFREYLKHKAKLLGHKNGLPFYDLFAPMGNSSRTFDVEQMRDFLVETFESFSADLAEMTKEMFDKKHIDVYPKKGKVGGAFCMGLHPIQQSRILLNHGNTLSDVVTAAHELGHAYHNLHIRKHLPLNTRYSMPVAETASTFNENILLNAILKTATKEEKINIIEQQLQDSTQIIVDIYSRFLFESEVFEKRKDSFLFADELEQIMLNAQKETYGDGLDSEYLHPYMWVNKSHYYSENQSFYNFPYAFGGLFAKGLYAIYKEDPNGFAEKYQKMLYHTTISSVEDVAKIMDIDLTKKEFWQRALKIVAEDIDTFIALTNE